MDDVPLTSSMRFETIDRRWLDLVRDGDVLRIVDGEHVLQLEAGFLCDVLAGMFPVEYREGTPPTL